MMTYAPDQALRHQRLYLYLAHAHDVFGVMYGCPTCMLTQRCTLVYIFVVPGMKDSGVA